MLKQLINKELNSNENNVSVTNPQEKVSFIQTQAYVGDVYYQLFTQILIKFAVTDFSVTHPILFAQLNSVAQTEIQFIEKMNKKSLQNEFSINSHVVVNQYLGGEQDFPDLKTLAVASIKKHRVARIYSRKNLTDQLTNDALQQVDEGWSPFELNILDRKRNTSHLPASFFNYMNTPQKFTDIQGYSNIVIRGYFYNHFSHNVNYYLLLLIKSLLEEDANNISDLWANEAFSTLHLACAFGTVDLVENFLQPDVSLDKADCLGLTTFHYACIGNNIPVVRWLLTEKKYGPNVSSGRYGAAPIYLAGAYGDATLMQLLCDHEVNLDVSIGLLKLSLFHSFIFINKLTALEFLLTKRPEFLQSPNYLDNKKPLQVAIEIGHLSVISYLTNKGASVAVTVDNASLYSLAEKRQQDISVDIKDILQFADNKTFAMAEQFHEQVNKKGKLALVGIVLAALVAIWALCGFPAYKIYTVESISILTKIMAGVLVMLGVGMTAVTFYAAYSGVPQSVLDYMSKKWGQYLQQQSQPSPQPLLSSLRTNPETQRLLDNSVELDIEQGSSNALELDESPAAFKKILVDAPETAEEPVKLASNMNVISLTPG